MNAAVAVRSLVRVCLFTTLAALAAQCGVPSNKSQAVQSEPDELVGAAAKSDAAVLPDGGDALVDASFSDGGSKADRCASTFGNGLTRAFGRLDGTVLAVVTPEDQQCAKPNSDHVVLQVLVNGSAYRMVINVQSSSSEPRVFFREVDRAMVGAPWEEGWHPNVGLDYVADLDQHGPFTPYPMGELVAMVESAIALDDKVSVFATSSGGTRADSAHLIHRNGRGNDGAVVLGAASSHPHWLLFHFDQQTF